MLIVERVLPCMRPVLLLTETCPFGRRIDYMRGHVVWLLLSFVSCVEVGGAPSGGTVKAAKAEMVYL